jgi:hypothetical protein
MARIDDLPKDFSFESAVRVLLNFEISVIKFLYLFLLNLKCMASSNLKINISSVDTI